MWPMSNYLNNEAALRELYADDDVEGDVWFGHALEDAQEQDRLQALWGERADAEVDEMRRLEDPEL